MFCPQCQCQCTQHFLFLFVLVLLLFWESYLESALRFTPNISRPTNQLQWNCCKTKPKGVGTPDALAYFSTTDALQRKVVCTPRVHCNFRMLSACCSIVDCALQRTEIESSIGKNIASQRAWCVNSLI